MGRFGILDADETPASKRPLVQQSSTLQLLERTHLKLQQQSLHSKPALAMSASPAGTPSPRARKETQRFLSQVKKSISIESPNKRYSSTTTSSGRLASPEASRIADSQSTWVSEYHPLRPFQIERTDLTFPGNL